MVIIFLARNARKTFHFLGLLVVENASVGGLHYFHCKFVRESIVENARFGRLHSQFLQRSSGKCSFFVILIFCKSLVENDGFGSVDSHFLRKSRGKCSFWKCGKGKGRSLCFLCGLLCKGRLQVPLGGWKVGACEFKFQFVAVTLGLGISIFFFFWLDSLCHWSVATAVAWFFPWLAVLLGIAAKKGRLQAVQNWARANLRSNLLLLYIGKREEERERQREKERERDREKEKERDMTGNGRGKRKRKGKRKRTGNGKRGGEEKGSYITCRGGPAFATHPCYHLLTFRKLTCRGQLAWATCTC